VVVEQDGAGLTQRQRCCIEITDGAEPVFLSGRLGVSEHGGDDDIEQVEHIVVGTRFQRAQIGEQRGDTPIIRQTRDDWALAALAKRARLVIRLAGSRSSDGRSIASACTSCNRSMARASSAGLCRAGPSRSRSSALVRPPLRHDQQVLEPPPLLWRHALGEALP
jgi:hypothetical protein